MLEELFFAYNEKPNMTSDTGLKSDDMVQPVPIA